MGDRHVPDGAVLPPFAYVFTHTDPRLMEMGVTEEMCQAMFIDNP